MGIWENGIGEKETNKRRKGKWDDNDKDTR